MSTRCQIAVKNGEGVSEVKIYKHSDGYPEGVLPILEPFAKAFAKNRGNDPEYCLAQIVREFAFIDQERDKTFYATKTDPYRYLGWGLDTSWHEDIEYAYIVNLPKGTVEVINGRELQSVIDGTLDLNAECEHADICEDERICLDCDKDMTEYLAAKAEYAFEGDR